MGLNSPSLKGGTDSAYRSVADMGQYLSLKYWGFLWPPGRISHLAELPVPPSTAEGE